MLPVFKVFSLVVRVFSRPVVNYIKSIHKSNFKNLTGVSKLLVRMGNRYHITEVWMNRKILGLKTDSDMFTKPLSPEIALEKGIELFYEVFFYSLIIGVACFELYKAHVSAEEKKAKDEQRLVTMEENIGKALCRLEGNHTLFETNLKEMDARIKKIADDLERSLEIRAQQLVKEVEAKEQQSNLNNLHTSMQQSVHAFEKKMSK